MNSTTHTQRAGKERFGFESWSSDRLSISTPIVACCALMFLSGLIVCQAGCKATNASEQATVGPRLTSAQIQRPLARTVTTTAAACANEEGEGLLISLEQCTYEGLMHFRHPLGLHTVRYDNISGTLLYSMPPGLNRIEQLTFSRDLQAHLVKIVQTYWQYEAAVQYEQLNAELSTLASQVVSIEQKKLGVSASSLIELNRAKLQQFDQSIARLSQHLPNHETGDSQTHLRQLLAYCGREYQYDQHYQLQSQSDHLKQVDYCLDCSIRSSLSLNPDLLVQRTEWLTAYNQQSAGQGSQPRSWLARKLRGRGAQPRQPQLPNTAYDLVCREQEKLELATNKLWDQLNAGREALELINEELALLATSHQKIEEAISQQQATLQDKLALESTICRTAMRRVILSMQLGLVSSQLLYQTGMLCQAFQIEPINFWMTAEASQQALTAPLPLDNLGYATARGQMIQETEPEGVIDYDYDLVTDYDPITG